MSQFFSICGTFLFSVSINSLTDARVPLHFQFPPTMNRPVPSETTRTVDGALLLPPALPLVPRLFVARTKAQLDPIDIVRLLALIVVVVVVVGDDVRVVGGAAVNMSALSVSPSFSFSLSTKARARFFCVVVARGGFLLDMYR